MGLKELPIIQYHNITPDPERHRMWVSVKAFEEHLIHLKQQNFKVICLDQAIAHMQRGAGTDAAAQPISLTFDNGFADFYEHALPLIRSHNIPVTLLLTPKRVGIKTKIRRP